MTRRWQGHDADALNAGLITILTLVAARRLVPALRRFAREQRRVWREVKLRLALEELMRQEPDAYGPDGEPLWEIPPPEWYGRD